MWILKITFAFLTASASFQSRSASAIQVNRPTAVTVLPPPLITLTPQQIDFYLKHYGGPAQLDQSSVAHPLPTRDDATAPRTIQPIEYFLPTIKPTSDDFYFPIRENADTPTTPTDTGSDYYRHMQPPPRKTANEPNYYALKPRKGTKKFNSQRKQINVAATKNAVVVPSQKTNVAAVLPPYETGAYPFEEYIDAADSDAQQAVATHHRAAYVAPRFAKANAAGNRLLRADELNTGEYLPSATTPAEGRSDSSDRAAGGSGDRVEYQMHGFNGPNSYKFGYDTGKIVNSESSSATETET